MSVFFEPLRYFNYNYGCSRRCLNGVEAMILHDLNIDIRSKVHEVLRIVGANQVKIYPVGSLIKIRVSASRYNPYIKSKLIRILGKHDIEYHGRDLQIIFTR